MKILLVDYAHESDRDFNLPIKERLDRLAELQTWSARDVLSASTLRGFGGLVIGGVPDNLALYPFSMASREMPLFREARIPVLGICLGHQVIGWNFDAGLNLGDESEHGIVTVRKTPEGAEDGLFRGLPEEFPVYTMHHASVTVPEGFTHLAESDGCVNQAHVGPNGLLYGVQFHPERSGEVGDAIFENFVRMSAIPEPVYVLPEPI